MPLAPNQQLYEYRIVRRLGQGGFGTVYLAHDTLLDRPVAIKELTITRQTDEQALKRFWLEARTAGGLNHPNIVTVYALKVEGSNVYLVMECVGGSLRGLLEKRGKLDIEQAVKIAIDVCEGLAAVHAKGIIHRDIKPENILLTEDGRAKVSDFGIAHVPRDAGGTSLTQAGFQPGTLVYMSPEQVLGKPVDARSDVYQVGELLYEMLAGRHYIDLAEIERQARDSTGGNSLRMQAKVFDLLADAICVKPPAPLKSLRPEISGQLATTVEAALAKNPAQRPLDGIALSHQLTDWRSGQPQQQPRTDGTRRQSPSQANQSEFVTKPEQLIHNGILVPPDPPYYQLTLTIRGERRELEPHQEEMAIAWARKIGTEYVQDSGFWKNFMRDFSAALGIKPRLSVDEVDFGPALEIVQAERLAKEQLTPEERKALAAQRKAAREQLKEKYGHVTVNGERVELGNYIAEPSGIFMGRGKHPLRGKWKQGARQSDITLNLSPDAPRPEGEWAEIIWQPKSLWVARWEDKLSGMLKYVRLRDNAPEGQERETDKYDKAETLEQNIQDIRAHIERDLADPDPKRRTIATACCLIDVFCLRVGDEKDPDEANIVGVTTLRPEHITLHEDGTAEFKFLGKDSVLWHKKIQPSEVVLNNLRELIQNARPSGSGNNKPQIFPAIDSSHVNAYLGEILPGLTAKVFRTHHATQAVNQSLIESGVEAGDAEYQKWGAVTMANLEAAILCNHYRRAPDNWEDLRKALNEKKDKVQERVIALRAELEQANEAMDTVKREAREKWAEASSDAPKEQIRASYAKMIEQAEKEADAVKSKLQRDEDALGTLKIQDILAVRYRTWDLDISLKSYIDPRVYYRWGQQVGYDVLGCYYPKALQYKFAWVKGYEQSDDAKR